MKAARRTFMHTLHLIWHLARRDFHLRYAGSLLGFLWSVTVPLSQLLMLAFVFGKVIPLNIANFPVFVFTGLLPWNWFSSSMLSAGSVFTESRDLLRHPNLDPAILVVVSILAHLLTLLVTLPVLFWMLYWYDLDVPWLFIPAFPLLVFAQGLLMTGMSLIIATANVFYRDVGQVVGIVVSLLFFMTPIWYAPPTTGEYAILFEMNPMSLIVQNYRRVLLSHQWLDWSSLVTTCLIGLGLLVLGYALYRRFDSDVIDAL